MKFILVLIMAKNKSVAKKIVGAVCTQGCHWFLANFLQVFKCTKF